MVMLLRGTNVSVMSRILVKSIMYVCHQVMSGIKNVLHPAPSVTKVTTVTLEGHSHIEDEKNARMDKKVGGRKLVSSKALTQGRTMSP